MAEPMVAYVVRAGFVFVDESGAAPRVYAAGETVHLPAAVGDAAHQLEPVAPPAEPTRRAPRRADAAAGEGAA